MKRTIYLSDELEVQVNQYLNEHPRETLSHIIQQALEVRFATKDVSKLLSLEGIVQEAPRNSSEQAENYQD
jgi:hypothetical protein